MQGEKFQGSLTSLECEYRADTMRVLKLSRWGKHIGAPAI